MKKWLLAVIVCTLVAAGCSKYKIVSELPETEPASGEGGQKTQEEEEVLSLETSAASGKRPVKVKGIYISGYMAGSEGFQAILDQIEGTEINAVVIDVKNDDGRITFAMDGAPVAKEIGASQNYIGDISSLMAELKSRGLYTIARVVAFRDPYLAEKKPEWSLKRADGSQHRDNKGMAWVNPYRTEVWDYLVSIGAEAARVGFDEIQFDYIRFATDPTMKLVAFDPEDTKGRSKTDIITEFMEYAYQRLSPRNVFVSADVFGTIIGSKVDAETVGQVYSDMACHLDYICPMIYPSHYGEGNFGIEHPDTEPYRTVCAALRRSKQDLVRTGEAEGRQAIVRPWLQDFTASYLKHHITYGPEEIRAQIQAVYDAGYDEWILWSASNQYTWEGLLTKEEAEREQEELAKRREEEARSLADSDEQKEEASVPSGQAALEEAAEQLDQGPKENQEPEQKGKRENRTRPNVVIVTTGGAAQ